MPNEVAIWVKGTIGMLPGGTVRVAEADRLMASITQKIQAGDTRKIRALVHGTFCRSICSSPVQQPELH